MEVGQWGGPMRRLLPLLASTSSFCMVVSLLLWPRTKGFSFPLHAEELEAGTMWSSSMATEVEQRDQPLPLRL